MSDDTRQTKTTRRTTPAAVLAARARNKVLRRAFVNIDNLTTVSTQYGTVTTDRYVLWVHAHAPAWLRPTLDSLPCDGVRYDHQAAAKTASGGAPTPLSDVQEVATEAFEKVIDRVSGYLIENALTPGKVMEVPTRRHASGPVTARLHHFGHRGALVNAEVDLGGVVLADGGQAAYDEHAAKVAEIDAMPVEPLSTAATARLSFDEQREATKMHASAEMAKKMARATLRTPHDAPLAILTPDGALAGTIAPIDATAETMSALLHAEQAASSMPWISRDTPPHIEEANGPGVNRCGPGQEMMAATSKGTRAGAR